MCVCGGAGAPVDGAARAVIGVGTGYSLAPDPGALPLLVPLPVAKGYPSSRSPVLAPFHLVGVSGISYAITLIWPIAMQITPCGVLCF